MKQNKEPRNKLTPIWSSNTQKRRQEYTVKIIYLINGVGKIGQIHAKKKETRPTSYTIYKTKLKMN